MKNRNMLTGHQSTATINAERAVPLWPICSEWIAKHTTSPTVGKAGSTTYLVQGAA